VACKQQVLPTLPYAPSATEIESIGRIGDLLHLDFGVMEACATACWLLDGDLTFAAPLQVFRDQDGRIYVISADDAIDHRDLIDYLPDSERREVVYDVRPSQLFYSVCPMKLAFP
jgi:hypothetical protein